MASPLQMEERAKEAFVDDNFELALSLYSQAIDLESDNPVLFADRAQTHLKLENYTEAVADANRAIELDPKITKAYLRKGLACIKLEEYETAKAALQIGSSLAPDDARFVKLINDCDKYIAEEAKSSPINTVDSVSHNALPSVVSRNESQPDPMPVENLQNKSVVEHPKPKYRHDYYNTDTEVVLTIFAKNIPAEYVTVDFGEQILSVSIEIPGEEAYHFQPRLFAKISPEQCKFLVLLTKVEIRLAKVEVMTWRSLEYSKEKSIPQKISTLPATTVKSGKPTYPSSKGKKDWDKLEAEVKKEEKDEKLDGDAALNKFFRDIYSDGDEEMRRAMMKSFVESNGTVLSTNWKDVGAKKVEGSPPDGMEMKKWEY